MAALLDSVYLTRGLGMEFNFDSLNLEGFGEEDDAETSGDVSAFVMELAESAKPESVYVEFDAGGKRAVKAKADAWWRDRVAALQHTARTVQTMHSMGLLDDAALAESMPWLWDREARKRARATGVASANKLMFETLSWLAESQPPMATIVATGLASVQCAKLGTSPASEASRKIRDWYKVTGHRLRKAQAAEDSAAYVAALEFQYNVLKSFLNTRFFAVRENARSVEDRALGGNNCRYEPTGAPKSAYKLVMHNQLGETIVSPSLKKLQPAGRVDAYEGIDSPETVTSSVLPFPKVTVKRKRI